MQINPSEVIKILKEQIKKYGIKSNDLLESIEFILTREF